MTAYKNMDAAQLAQEYNALLAHFEACKAQNLKLKKNINKLSKN